MAHFAEIDEAGTVLRVIVVPDENEADGAQWCADLMGGSWLQTSFNTHAGEHREGGTPLRKNFAGKTLEQFIKCRCRLLISNGD